LFVQDNSENLRAYAYVWSNPNDPDLYAEWDFEVSLQYTFIYSCVIFFHMLGQLLHTLPVHYYLSLCLFVVVIVDGWIIEKKLCFDKGKGVELCSRI
jgi:hypothetical protein